ncbi:tyrosine-type recombinase/integrase, partial [Nocardiopsis terrae]
LIVSAAGKRISRQAVADVVARFTERALGRRLTPHSLRKSTAVDFHQAGYSDRDLKRWGRWRTLNTVSTYVDVADDDGHPGLVAAQMIATARPQIRRAPAGRLRKETS